MKFLSKAKDGGPKSPVDGYYLVEWKGLFSIALLKFNKGGRENYHTHAFHALTWFLWGDLIEEDIDGTEYRYTRSLLPKITPRAKNHRVRAARDSWCFTIRGPWSEFWTEEYPERKTITFTHGRRVVSTKENKSEKLS